MWLCGHCRICGANSWFGLPIGSTRSSVLAIDCTMEIPELTWSTWKGLMWRSRTRAASICWKGNSFMVFSSLIDRSGTRSWSLHAKRAGSFQCSTAKHSKSFNSAASKSKSSWCKTILTVTFWARQKATSTTIAWSSSWSGNYLLRINLIRLNSKSTRTTSSSCQKAGTATFMYGLKKHCRTKGPGRRWKMAKTILRKKFPSPNCQKSSGSLSPVPIPIKLDCGTMSRAGWCMFWR